jgi:hypothetical protein
MQSERADWQQRGKEWVTLHGQLLEQLLRFCPALELHGDRSLAQDAFSFATKAWKLKSTKGMHHREQKGGRTVTKGGRTKRDWWDALSITSLRKYQPHAPQYIPKHRWSASSRANRAYH